MAWTELYASEAVAREAICAEARAWLSTPYHHRARIKGVGVDCAQFPLKVYANVGLIEDFDTGEYPADWHIHRDVERYLKAVMTLGGVVTEDAIQPGDLLLVKYARVYSHGAIWLGDGVAIHASQSAGCVTLAALQDPDFRDRAITAFSYWAR